MAREADAVPAPSKERKRLATRIATGVVREVMLRDKVLARPHRFFGAWPLAVAACIAASVIGATDLEFPVRIALAVALAASLVLAVDNFRLRRKVRAAVELLEIHDAAAAAR